MDPQADLPALVEDLEVNIDELTTTLAPLLTTPLGTTASTLPLLDKAKLYVLAAYSIESLLYSTLQASGVNAKDHAIFRELGRLKGYFGKIKDIDDRGVGPAKPGQRLDVGAANRFIKHGLAGNEKYDLERKERMAKEKARAHLKAAKMAKRVNKKFDDEGREVEGSVTPKKRSVEEKSHDDEQVGDDDEEIITGLEEADASSTAAPTFKKTKLSGADPMDIEAATSPAVSSAELTSKHKGLKNKSKKKSIREASQDAPNAADFPATSISKPRNKKGKKSATNAGAATVDVEQDAAGAEKPKRGRGRPKKAN